MIRSFLTAGILCGVLWLPVNQPGAQPLFQSDEVLNLRVVTSVKKLMNDRVEESEYYAATVDVPRQKGEGTITLPLRLRTRGNFRREYEGCHYPPLMFNFSKSQQLQESVFAGQNKIKAVLACTDEDRVVREYLVYRFYNLLTPLSFRARLARITFCEAADTTRKTKVLCFLLESEKLVEARTGLQKVEPPPTSVNAVTIRHDVYLPMAVFQVMIGNTDWSVPFQHNMVLMAPPDDTMKVLPIPYDFDFCGFVDAPYAAPHEELQLESVRDRRYRGYCIPVLDSLTLQFEKMRSIREQALKLVSDNALLSPAGKRYCTGYLQEFFDMLENKRRIAEIFLYPCDPTGAGNVIIRGYPKARKAQ